MGLDISVYSKLVIDTNANMDEDEFDIYCVAGSFPEHIKPFIDGQCYKSEGEKDSFRAGSYGGYNAWRNTLVNVIHNIDAKVMWENVDEYKDLPFFNLINFSDCEGMIGNVMAKKLSKDFQDHQHMVDELEDDYFKEKYADWRNAFEVASNEGAVCFH